MNKMNLFFLILSIFIIGCQNNKKNEYKLSTESYIAFEYDLVKILKTEQWIKSFEVNRQDSFIEWTIKGKKKNKNFIQNIKDIYPIKTEIQKKLLYEFAYYHFILEKPESEKIKSTINSMVGNSNFILVVKNKDKTKKVYNFKNKNDETLLPIVKTALKNDDEIIFYENESIITRSAKLTPFGAKNY